MKTALKLAVTSILPVTATSFAADGPGSGNGTGPGQLEGFKNYAAQSASLRAAIAEANTLVNQLGLTNRQMFPELASLQTEIVYSKYILVNQDVELSPNRAPGDYAVGTFLVASTDLSRGAPTRIYPRLIGQLSRSQMVQMVIHEALHRSLQEPMNGYESVVEKITNIITQYAPGQASSVLRSYLNVVKSKRIPWPVNINTSSDNANMSEGSLRALYDDNTIVETGNTARILIYLQSESGASDHTYGVFDSRIVVKDQYRNVIYTKILPMNLTLQQADALALPFIRESIKKIQDDLSWQ